MTPLYIMPPGFSGRAMRQPDWKAKYLRRQAMRAYAAVHGQTKAAARYGVSRQRVHQVVHHPEAAP